MSSLLGWKDILRPIRDGYRHLFPSPDTGPSPEERDRQRKLDALKGFTYLDTIDQLEGWTETDSDQSQRANTSLLRRPEYTGEENRSAADVLLCHDYSGNYHDYEAVQANGVNEESYTCEHLQYIDTFVYFSHKLVCVPPPSWTNLLHRNGVKALGTLLVEPQTQGAERLLVSEGRRMDGSPTYPIAETLAKMASHYGFDGWLVNIEKPFPKEHWHCSAMETFLRQLRDALGPNRRLIWYDAITIDDKVSYQNAVNLKNLSFAKACGSILVNYCWKEEDARASYQLAKLHDLPPGQVFFGVDVWAQNKSSFTHPRTTYPEYRGGGTNTGIAVDKLAQIGLSAGIFAPAWSFEHFPTRGHTIDCAMWDGSSIPSDTTCSCGDLQSYHPNNRLFSITSSARQYPAGSRRFFYTDFIRGFGCHNEQAAKHVYNGRTMHANLSCQSILPHISNRRWQDDDDDSGNNALSHRVESVVGETRLVIEAQGTSPRKDGITRTHITCLSLFRLAMPADGSLQLTISYRGVVPLSTASASFYLKFTDGTRFLTAQPSGNLQSHLIPVCLGEKASGHSQLEEVGVHVRAPSLGKQTIRILEVHEIAITPRVDESISYVVSIHNVRCEKRGSGDTEHHRLYWTYSDHSREELVASGMPYSDITGPFSYFDVEINGTDLGRVYALECIVPALLAEDLEDTDQEVSLTGFGFDGKRLAHKGTIIQIKSIASLALVEASGFFLP